MAVCRIGEQAASFIDIIDTLLCSYQNIKEKQWCFLWCMAMLNNGVMNGYGVGHVCAVVWEVHLIDFKCGWLTLVLNMKDQLMRLHNEESW